MWFDVNGEEEDLDWILEVIFFFLGIVFWQR
jgi:hypothetical protein